MYAITKKNIVGKCGILIIHSDNKDDAVQSIEYQFQNDHFQLNIKINPNKWNDVFKNILKDVKNEIISYDANFFNYFDQKEYKENKQTFYFSTKFKEKMDMLIFELQKKDIVPLLLSETLNIKFDHPRRCIFSNLKLIDDLP